MWSRPQSYVLQFATISLVALALSAPVSASDYETTLKVKRPFGDRVSASQEFRMATDLNTMTYRHLDVGLQVQATPAWQLAGHYRIADSRSNLNQWTVENRLYLQAEKRLADTHQTFGVKIRNRIESRFREGKDPTYRARLRVQIKAKKPWAKKATPFARNEFFYDLNTHRYSINRVDIGLDFGKKGGLGQSLYLKTVSRRSNQQWTTSTNLVYKISL